MYLFTWLDLRRQVWEELKAHSNGQYPKGITWIDFSWSGLDVFVEPGQEAFALAWLAKIFPGWFDPDKRVIRLEGDEEVPVEIEVRAAEADSPHQLPLWWDISRLPDYDGERQNPAIQLPQPWDPTGPHVAAFYSFKGGVSRTTHLLGCLAALREHKLARQNIRVLLIDADVEAPGFSFWSDSSQRVSYVDLLEMLHLRPERETEKTIKYLAGEIEKTKIQMGRLSWYQLPAFRNEAQLLNWPIKPEHLVRGLSSPWILADRIQQLGKALNVQLVLVDLRAGLSEMSSPLMLDPRVDRFLVTTLSQQSIHGAKLILRQLAKTAPCFKSVQDGDFSDPTVIFSMIHEETFDKEEHQQAKEEFAALYPESSEDLGASSRLEFISTKFAQELLSIKGWDDFYSKIAGTQLEKELFEVVSRWMPPEPALPAPDPSKLELLRNLCKDLIYAEHSQAKGLLFTHSLQNLAIDFKDSLPNLVVMGSKGSGKTYTFLQLSRMGDWSNFCKEASVTQQKLVNPAFFPFLESANQSDAARTSALQTRIQYLGPNAVGDMASLRDQILHASQSETQWTEVDWEAFWIKQFAKALELECSSPTPLELHQAVKRKNKPVILLIDGLEDLFKDLHDDATQQRALRALIQLPGKFRQIREVQIGLIIFARRDYAREAILQNFGQFSTHYERYELRWEFKDMLLLLAWLCSKVEIIKHSEAQILEFSYAELDRLLYPLWGMRMGAPNSREARTSVWVYCALADYNNHLQARDLIRLLYEAARHAKGKDPTRLLSPSEIKKALPNCSKEKVEEALLEFPQLADIRDLFDKSEAPKRVPFRRSDFNLSASDLDFLEFNGIISEVKDEYHIPEIYRFGLKFELTKKARPRVVAFGRQLLGSILKEL